MKKTAFMLLLGAFVASPALAGDIMGCISPLSSHFFALKVRSEGDSTMGYLQVDAHESIWPLHLSPKSSVIEYQSDLGRGSLRVRLASDSEGEGWHGTLDVIDSIPEMEYHDIPLECVFSEE